jgi:ankyrin repeat protein
VERARTLLLTDSAEQFELFRKGVSSPSKGTLHPQPSPSPKKGRPGHGSEVDDWEAHALPTLPAYKPSTHPEREGYLRTMHALLQEAVQNGEVDTARYVLSSCPKVIAMRSKEPPPGGGECQHQTILHTVCEQQMVDFVDLFLQYNPDPDAQTADGKSYLHLVSDPTIVEMLCIDGADPNLLDKTGQTPLHVYVAHKLYECARNLVRRGADPNIEDWRNRKSPLQSAAAMGDYLLLHILLTESKIAPKIDKPDFDGNTLLHLVCMTEAPGSQVFKCIMLLLDRGASPRAVNIRGITPLHFIAGNQHIWHSSEASKEEVVQLVQLLLTLSVDVNARDADGCTALVVACAHRKFELCQTLLKCSADMNIPCAMNSYLLRRGNHSEEESQVDGMDLTASDLFPPGRKRNEIFAHISSRQTPVDLESRTRCMNCAVSVKGGFFSQTKFNCCMCGRVVCEDCTDKLHVVKADRAPPFLCALPGEDLLHVCIVCGPIIAENYGAALRDSKRRSGSKGFLDW